MLESGGTAVPPLPLATQDYRRVSTLLSNLIIAMGLPSQLEETGMAPECHR